MDQSKKKENKKITLSQSNPQDSKPEKEEHLFSTQLISQERNPTTEINHFEGSGPEWLVPKGNPFLCFWQRTGFCEGEREITYWCMPAKLTLFFSFLFFLCFSVFSLLFLFFFLSFLLLLVSISWFSSSQSYPLPHCRCFFFFHCTQQGLLFIMLAVIGFYYFSP